MPRRGFSVIELLVVIGVIAGVSAIVIPSYRNYQLRSDLDNAAQSVTQALGRARLLSVNGERDSVWGVYVPGATLFKGATYASRNTVFDEHYPISPTIEVTGLREVNYSRLQGLPSATGTIVLTALSRERRTINIMLTREGIPVTAEDTLTICHCAARVARTIRVSDNAWPGHFQHGDFLGACTGRLNECR